MKETTDQHSNRLTDSLSPYLLQHAHNPVDWYPWGPEALNKAKAQDKPLFISIGYSACHWCHVMAHESFEDEEVAAVLNEHFVSIKVDREERPDLDEIYMQATVSMNQGHGGWPMSVFATPAGEPFYTGTYFRRDDFLRLTRSLADTWENRREDISKVADQLREHLNSWAQGSQVAEGILSREVLTQAAGTVARYFDLDRGGLRSDGNKFPPSMTLELLLRSHLLTGDRDLLPPVESTLDAMARGGIYDHLGGGICRYSTDPNWLVPHFEKMLYDQALVSSIYVDGYQMFNKARYAEIARGIFDYVIRDLQAPVGGFYSTRDADSEGLEGKYYVWTREEVVAVLGAEQAALFCDYYDVSAEGNWNERFGHAPPGPKNILNIKRDPADVARDHGLTEQDMQQQLDGMRNKLFEVRQTRVAPGLDDKILTSWNGLMIASLAKGARVLEEPHYADAAARAATFVLDAMRQEGRLLHTHRKGHSRGTAYLSDYAFFIEGLLNLYEATFDRKWLLEAESLAEICARHYYDNEGGGFFFTADDGESLITRTKNPRDGAIPSGNSVHAHNLLRLASLLDHEAFKHQAESIFRALGNQAQRMPMAYERLLCALDFYHATIKEIAVVYPDAQQPAPLLGAVYSAYLPNKVVAGVQRTAQDDALAERLPLLKGKVAIGGKATVYVCENYVCKSPVHDPAQVRALLWPPQARE